MPHRHSRTQKPIEEILHFYSIGLSFIQKEAIPIDDHLPPGTYIIPRPIARGFQIIPGMGLKDASFAIAGLALALFFWLVLHAFGVGFLYRALAALLPAFVGIVLAIPIEDFHIWEFVRDVRDFHAKPKTLYYDWSRDDW